MSAPEWAGLAQGDGTPADSPAARRALAPHGLTVDQVVKAVRSILETGDPDSASRLVWAVRDFVPKSEPGRRKPTAGAGGGVR